LPANIREESVPFTDDQLRDLAAGYRAWHEHGINSERELQLIAELQAARAWKRQWKAAAKVAYRERAQARAQLGQLNEELQAREALLMLLAIKEAAGATQ
jgi:hypothetical protein